PFCMGNGQHILGTLAPMVLGNAMIIGGIAEITIFLIFSKVIRSDPIWGSEKRRSFKFYALGYCVLPVLILSLMGAMYQEFSSGIGMAELVRYSWLVVVLGVSAYFSSRSYQLVHHNIHKRIIPN